MTVDIRIVTGRVSWILLALRTNLRTVGMRRAALAEPGGFTAISRGLSGAIPPDNSITTGSTPGGVPAGRRCDPYRGRALELAARHRGCRSAQPPANGWHPSGM